MISSKMSLHAFWSVPVKVWNSYENAMTQRLSEGSGQEEANMNKYVENPSA